MRFRLPSSEGPGVRREATAEAPAVLRVVGVLADLLRVAAVVGIVVAGVFYGRAAALVLGFVLAVMLVPRIAALPRPVDLAVGITWLAAGWANAAGWYLTVPWVDIPIHATTPGASAAALYLLLVRVRLVPPLYDPRIRRSALVLLILALAALIAVLWEFYEWIRYAGAGPPLVGYDDTVGDLLMGCIGSIVAGVGLALWAGAGRRTPRAPTDERDRGA